MSEFVNTRIAEIYRVKYQLDRGSFGTILVGLNLQTRTDVAIKVESMKAKNPQLHHEYSVLKAFQGQEGFAEIFLYTQEKEHNILIMERLGQSLQSLFAICRGKFTMKCLLMIAEQVLTRLESLHEKGFIHRDIKPANILVGEEDAANLLYLIDFGMASKYRDDKTGEHIPYREAKELLGTPLFASINAGLQYEQSRKDDLESFGYVLAYFYWGGKLPWSKIKSPIRDEKFLQMTEVKAAISYDLLFIGMPKAFKVYMEYCKKLKFDEDPDYGYLRGLFRTVFYSRNYSYDLNFDWGLDV